jgi:hypothetical protein
VYDLLEVRVQVWFTCGACRSGGKVPGTRGLVGCPACHDMQRTLRLRIQRTVFDDLDLADAVSDEDPNARTCCRR